MKYKIFESIMELIFIFVFTICGILGLLSGNIFMFGFGLLFIITSACWFYKVFIEPKQKIEKPEQKENNK